MLAEAPQDKHVASLPYASSLCGACFEVCPVRIDIPSVLVHLRAEAVAAKGNRTPEAAGMAALAWIFGNPRRYEAAQKAGALARYLGHEGTISRLPWPGSKWTVSRDAPAPPKESFRAWWRRTRG
jgi:L-lactate dehydrogenase complex protein LldF